MLQQTTTLLFLLYYVLAARLPPRCARVSGLPLHITTPKRPKLGSRMHRVLKPPMLPRQPRIMWRILPPCRAYAYRVRNYSWRA